jgi:uncharacterized protein YjaG (DUF416 family)
MNLRRALDVAWEIGKGQQVTAEQVQCLKDSCESIVPESEDFPSVEATAAQEAAFSILVLLEHCLDPDARHAVRISSFSRDTIDMFVQMRDRLEPIDPELELKILRDPLMVREFEKQEEDLVRLERQSVLDETLVEAFRNDATDGGLSFLGWS